MDAAAQKPVSADERALKQTSSGDDPMRLSILGATGSIGTSTLDLVNRTPDKFDVVALTAQRSVSALAQAAIKCKADLAVIGDATLYQDLKEALAGHDVAVAAGANALVEAAGRPVDCTMAAIVGAAGLQPTLAAVRQGGRIALANKECLVTAGDVFIAQVEEAQAELLPVDSEHSAVFQVVSGQSHKAIERITLTASGGPFREWSTERMAGATREDALRHPNWSMGDKITIDSATMMNKGLELIEAYHLFPVRADQLDAVIHPQSVVHCMVGFCDGSVLAQMSQSDMRSPIAVALSWPGRMHTPVERLDLAALGELTFSAPDNERFPALGLARQALQRGGTAPGVLNAANEIAVEAFLAGKIGFPQICECVAECLEKAEALGLLRMVSTVDAVLQADQAARELANALIAR